MSFRWIVRALVVVMISLLGFVALTKARIGRVATDTVGTAGSPTLTAASGFGQNLKAILTAPFRVTRTAAELETLRAQVRQLTSENARRAELESENSELRRELNFFERTQLPYTVARIINRVKEGGAEFFVLNRGADDNVQFGAPIAVDGAIIGKVVKVSDAISIAAPLWTSSMKTAATFAGSEKTAGIVEGELNVNLRMSLIPKDAELHEGMVVITSGLEAGIPRGFVIGLVARITSSQEELFQTAYLTPPAGANEATIVSIIRAHEIE